MAWVAKTVVVKNTQLAVKNTQLADKHHGRTKHHGDYSLSTHIELVKERLHTRRWHKPSHRRAGRDSSSRRRMHQPQCRGRQAPHAVIRPDRGSSRGRCITLRKVVCLLTF